MSNDKNEMVPEESSPVPSNYKTENTDTIIDPSVATRETIFLGSYPFETILESIQSQFENYINLEDRTNYLEIFYNQFTKSYQALYQDDGNENPQEMSEALDQIYNQLIQTMINLLDIRLGLGINGFEEGQVSTDDLHYILSRLYEYFILRARHNFKIAIATSLSSTVRDMMENSKIDDTYFTKLQELLELYSPLISNIPPTEFIRFTGEREILELFETHRVVGNFLLKYSPKLYQNEDLAVEIINYVTAYPDLGKDLNSDQKSETEDNTNGRSTE